jgi:superfamily I DNA and/or RNA helicase
LNLKAARQHDEDSAYGELLDSLSDDKRVTIVSTTAHIVDRLTQSKMGSVLGAVFDLVVLDESSQIPMTLALKPLASLHPDAQLIVAGDHKQMPPIEKLDPPKNAEYLVGSIQTYLIKRFNAPHQPLLINYRSNQDLVDYAKSLEYPAALKAANTQKDLIELVAVNEVLKSMPAGLPNTAAYNELLRPERRVAALIHNDPTSSQANELEAGLVAGLAFALRHAMAHELNTGAGEKGTPFSDEKFFSEGIGIVTPHKAQKALVLRKLRELFPKASPEAILSAVDTVERFQGGQRDTIIVSYGVGDTDIIEGEEQFLLQLERTNVAVSRARAKCIVLMPKSLAYHLPTDQKAADTSFALKSYLEEFCNHRTPLTIELNKVIRLAEVRWH